MPESVMKLDVSEGLARLRFTEAARGNPIDLQFCNELCSRAIELSTRRDIRAVLVTADGKNFSFGGDIASFIAKLEDLPAEIMRMTAAIHSAVTRLQRMDAPMVVAVQGVCAGGMTAFVAGCDIVVSADSARFVSAYAGIGYSCDASSSVMFSRRMGLSRARSFILRNQTLDASKALASGLIDEMVPADQLLTHAELIAREFVAGPTKAYGEIRRLMLSAHEQPLETQMELEAQALARIASTQDAREGLLAFSQKRKPAFIGD